MLKSLGSQPIRLPKVILSSEEPDFCTTANTDLLGRKKSWQIKMMLK